LRSVAVRPRHNNVVVGYDDGTGMVYQEPNGNSGAWNTEIEDMLAYSGNNMLCIKTGIFHPHMQKLQGFVVGFKGSKSFCLHYISQTIDVRQSASLYRYMEKKDYETAYKVACLGVPEAIWHFWAIDALPSLSWDISPKAPQLLHGSATSCQDLVLTPKARIEQPGSSGPCFQTGASWLRSSGALFPMFCVCIAGGIALFIYLMQDDTSAPTPQLVMPAPQMSNMVPSTGRGEDLQLMEARFAVRFAAIEQQVQHRGFMPTANMRVMVKSEFLVDGRQRTLLALGLKGTVKRFDAEGDAFIRFDGLILSQWVKRHDFVHLQEDRLR